MSVFLVLLQCQQGYSAPSTLCDEWCSVHDRTRCPDEDPAECVATCEQRRAAFVEHGGTTGACDEAWRAMMDCIRTVPDEFFDCNDPSRSLVEQACARESIVLSVCENTATTSWRIICSNWALQCTSTVGGDSWDRLFQSCLPSPARLDCPDDQQVMLDCLASRDLSCDVLPADDAACQNAKLALDSCHPYLRPLCAAWSGACGKLDSPEGGPLDGASHSFANCLAARPVDPGSHCMLPRDALYRCLWNVTQSRGQRCDSVPFLAPECEEENAALKACTR